MLTRYKLTSRQGLVGQGVMNSQYVGVAAIAKTSSPDHPHTVTNEFICNELGRTLGLPLPPGFVIDDGGTLWFGSLNFNQAGQRLPPADAAALAQHDPDLAAGIVIFDSWIVNPDRHTSNYSFDRVTGESYLFDHGHAFFHGVDGRTFLEAARQVSKACGHSLAGNLVDVSGMRTWIDRIAQLPEYRIRQIVAAALQISLPVADEQFCIDYLLQRRRDLKQLISQDRGCFPGIPQQLWAAF
jgi:hypothetical protein